MSKCKDCGAPMKPLFSGEYCSAECDRPKPKVDPAKITKDPASSGFAFPPYPVWGGFLTVGTDPPCPQCGKKACMQTIHPSGTEELACINGHCWVGAAPTQQASFDFDLSTWVPTDGLLN